MCWDYVAVGTALRRCGFLRAHAHRGLRTRHDSPRRHSAGYLAHGWPRAHRVRSSPPDRFHHHCRAHQTRTPHRASLVGAQRGGSTGRPLSTSPVGISYLSFRAPPTGEPMSPAIEVALRDHPPLANSPSSSPRSPPGYARAPRPRPRGATHWPGSVWAAPETLTRPTLGSSTPGRTSRGGGASSQREDNAPTQLPRDLAPAQSSLPVDSATASARPWPPS